MNVFIKLLLSMIFFFISPFVCADGLRGVSSTLKSVQKPIEAAIAKAELLYETNGGVELNQEESVSSSNSFLSKLEISTDYNIELRFPAEQPSQSNRLLPFTHAMLDKRIIFIPITDELENNAIITTWECLTNIDEGAEMFMGHDVDSMEGNVSIITDTDNASDNPYISNCVFITTETLEGLL